jgi:hypothetical protein
MKPNEKIISDIYQQFIQGRLATQLSDIYQPLIQRRLVAQLRDLIGQMNQSQKIAVVQVLVHQLSKFEAPLFKVELTDNYFKDKIHTAFAIAEFLSKEVLRDLIIEILEELRDETNDCEGV